MDTFATCHERKPRLHDDTVTEGTDKYRLVRIPPSSREPGVRQADRSDWLSVVVVNSPERRKAK